MRRVSLGPVSVPLPVVVLALAAIVAVVAVSLLRAADGSTTAGGARPTTPGSSPASRSRPSSVPGTPSAPAARLAFAYPKDGVHVSRSPRLLARGKAVNLGGNSVWVLGQNAGLTVTRPAVVKNGQWTFHARALTRSAQKQPYDLTMVLVLADARCSAKLAAAARSPGRSVAALPNGCKAFDTATVKVAAQ